MSENTVTPPTGRPPEPEQRSYFNIKGSLFVYTTGKGTPEQASEYVNGYLRAFHFVWDTGHQAPRAQDCVPARWTFVGELESPEFGSVKLEVGAASALYSLLSSVLQVADGSYLGMVVKAGDQKGVLLNIATWSPDRGWTHLFAPKKDDRSLDERLAEAIEKCRSHPSYRMPVNPDHKNRRVMPPSNYAPQGAPPQTPAPTPFSGSAEGGSNPASQAPGDNAPRTAPVPEGKTAFGYVPSVWPLPYEFTVEATDKRMGTLSTRLAARELYGEENHLDMVQAVNEQYDTVTDFGYYTMGEVALAIDFARNATAEQWAKAIAEAFPPKEPQQPSADEYDPFADE